MNCFVKKIQKKIIINLHKVVFFSKIFDIIFEFSYDNKISINIRNKYDLIFSCPNTISKWRIQTFFSKEPEIIRWIDKIPEGSVVWDIGANIGLYSVYAAVIKKCKVYAFEPSVFNLELLARNIYLNKCNNTNANSSGRIVLCPIALSNHNGIDTLELTTTEWGGALSTFGDNIDWKGELIKSKFSYSCMGLKVDDSISYLNLEAPDYLKIDVDGIEHLILQGALNTLKKLKSVYIEINDNFKLQASICSQLLEEAGLTLLEKHQNREFVRNNNEFKSVFNQVWVRV